MLILSSRTSDSCRESGMPDKFASHPVAPASREHDGDRYDLIMDMHLIFNVYCPLHINVMFI